MDIDYDNLIIFKDFEILVNNNFLSCRYDKKDFYILYVTEGKIKLMDIYYNYYETYMVGNSIKLRSKLTGRYNGIIEKGRLYISKNKPDIADSSGRYYIMRFASVSGFLNKSPIKISIENNDLNSVNMIFKNLYVNYHKDLKKEKNLYYAIKILELFGIIKKEYNDAESKNNHLCFTAKNIKKYINENLNASKTDLEKVFGKNKDHIEREFKKEFGETIQDFKNREKCKLAKKLLEDEKLSLEKVAEKSGFNNVNNFRNIFKKIIGQTPSEYRKNLKHIK